MLRSQAKGLFGPLVSILKTSLDISVLHACRPYVLLFRPRCVPAQTTILLLQEKTRHRSAQMCYCDFWLPPPMRSIVQLHAAASHPVCHDLLAEFCLLR